MNPIQDYQDVLQNIEAAVVQVWREHREMTNYTIQRAYEAAIAYYNAQVRELTPKPVNLAGLEAKVYEEIREMCEWRLGRVAEAPELPELKPIPLEDLVACLRKLNKSVEFWTKEGGRQGYLNHIERYV